MTEGVRGRLRTVELPQTTPRPAAVPKTPINARTDVRIAGVPRCERRPKVASGSGMRTVPGTA
jgi:hypothetical protein